MKKPRGKTVGGDATSHPLTSENYYPNKIPNFFIDNEMSDC